MCVCVRESVCVCVCVRERECVCLCVCLQTEFSCGSSFGYNDCKRCLSCCNATSSLPATCTNPLFQSREPSSSDLCPAPPHLSYDDIAMGTTGRLDSDLVYVDEYLIDKAKDLDPEVFIQRVLGGFVMTYADPDFGQCAESVDAVDSVRERAADLFTQCTNISNTDYFTLDVDALAMEVMEFREFLKTLNTPEARMLIELLSLNFTEIYSFLNSPENCPDLYGNSSVSGSGGGEGIDGDSVIDGLSRGLFTTFGGTCSEHARSALPLFTPNRTNNRISATVYYNNNVSG